MASISEATSAVNRALAAIQSRRGRATASGTTSVTRGGGNASAAINISSTGSGDLVDLGLKVASSQVKLAGLGCGSNFLDTPITFRNLFAFDQTFRNETINPDVAVAFGYDTTAGTAGGGTPTPTAGPTLADILGAIGPVLTFLQGLGLAPAGGTTSLTTGKFPRLGGVTL